jgi:hypothetical protein
MVAVGFLFNFPALKPFPLPDHRKLLLIGVLVLTALLFVDYFVIHEYLPGHIPDTPINITGLYLVVCFGGVLYFVFRKMLKEHQELSVSYLVIFGTLIVLFSEVIFQFFRQFTFDETYTNAERVRYFFTGVAGLSIAGGFLALMIALEFKLKNRLVHILIIAGCLILFYYVSPYIIELLKN